MINTTNISILDAIEDVASACSRSGAVCSLETSARLQGAVAKSSNRVRYKRNLVVLDLVSYIQRMANVASPSSETEYSVSSKPQATEVPAFVVPRL